MNWLETLKTSYECAQVVRVLQAREAAEGKLIMFETETRLINLKELKNEADQPNQIFMLNAKRKEVIVEAASNRARNQRQGVAK